MLFIIIWFLIIVTINFNNITFNLEPTQEDLLTFIPFYMFYDATDKFFIDNNHIFINNLLTFIFIKNHSLIIIIILVNSEFLFKTPLNPTKMRDTKSLWSIFYKKKNTINEFFILRFLKFNITQSLIFLKKFAMLIKIIFKKNYFKIFHHFSQQRLTLIFFYKKINSKYLLWRPLFKRSSYIGLYSSLKLKWKKLK